MTSEKPIGERVSTLEQWTKGHDTLCAERYGELKENMRWLIRGVFGLLIGIIAWLAVQLWNGRSNVPPPAATAVVQTGPVPAGK